MSKNNEQKPPEINKAFLKDLLRVFLIPTLLNKAVMFYFGLQYARYPGEGYGYGLIISILYFLISVAFFLWKYKDVEDP